MALCEAGHDEVHGEDLMVDVFGVCGLCDDDISNRDPGKKEWRGMCLHGRCVNAVRSHNHFIEGAPPRVSESVETDFTATVQRGRLVCGLG